MSRMTHHHCRMFLKNVFLQAAIQKQQQADLVGQGTLDSSSFNNGEQVSASAVGRLCAGSTTVGEEAPTVNGGQSDSYSESMDREQEPELAEEVSENGPLLGQCPDTRRCFINMQKLLMWTSFLLFVDLT